MKRIKIEWTDIFWGTLLAAMFVFAFTRPPDKLPDKETTFIDPKIVEP